MKNSRKSFSTHMVEQQHCDMLYSINDFIPLFNPHDGGTTTDYAPFEESPGYLAFHPTWWTNNPAMSKNYK